jgi:hypothetical protein
MSKATIKRHIARALYTLKRRWPTPIQLHVSGEPTPNYDTGEIEVNETTVKVRKAVELPRNEVRKFVYDLSYIASAKNFTYGALFDQASRIVLIDRRDLPKCYHVTNDFEITVDGERFKVNTVSELPYKTGYLVGLLRSEAGARNNDAY